MEYSLNRVDGKVKDRVVELGGVAKISNPVAQVIKPLAEDNMKTGEDAVRDLRKDHSKNSKQDWCGRLPSRVPERPTLVNVAERIHFEEWVKATAKAYESFTGETVEYKLGDMRYEVGE